MTQRGRATRPTGPSGRPRRSDGPRGADRGGAPRGDLAARRTRLREVIEPVVTAAGYDLEDLSVSRAGRRHVVRVIVDADGGINLDAVADVSRAVSAALDAAEEAGGDIVAGEYQLEVSSPVWTVRSPCPGTGDATSAGWSRSPCAAGPATGSSPAG